MDRHVSASGAPVAERMQLKAICIWVLLCSLVPMFGYYYHVFRIVDFPIEVSGFPAGRDFVNLWSGGRIAFSGDYPVLFDAARYARYLQQHIHPSMIENGLVWSYPPTAFWIGLPFAGLPFYAALPLWYALGIAAVVWAFRLAAPRPTPLWAVPFLVLAPGVLMVLYFGQTGLLTSALFIGGILLARDRPVLAGALLAGFVVKPHMGLAIPVVLLALRHWRAIFATAGFAALYVLVTVLVFGWEPWDLYLSVTLPKHLGLLTPWGKILPWMFTAQYFQLLAAGLSEALAMRLHWLIALAALGVTAYTLPRLHDVNLQLLLAAAVTLLVSPYMQAYELALPAIAALRAAAYAPAGNADGYATTRSVMVIVTLMAPVIGFIAMGVTSVNPVSLLMLIVVGAAAQAVWPTVAERRAYFARLQALPRTLRAH